MTRTRRARRPRRTTAQIIAAEYDMKCRAKLRQAAYVLRRHPDWFDVDPETASGRATQLRGIAKSLVPIQAAPGALRFADEVLDRTGERWVRA